MLLLLLLLIQLATAAGERIAVLDFDSTAEEEWVGVLTEQVRAGVLLALDPRDYSVITRENMLQYLEDMGKDISCVEGSCEVELARNIGADFVISGTVSEVEKVYIINMKLHSSRSGQLLKIEKVQGAEPLELIERVQSSAEALVQELGSAGTSAVGEVIDLGPPTNLEFMLRSLDAGSLYLDLSNGKIRTTQSRNTAKLVFSEFRVHRDSRRQQDQFLLPLDQQKIYFVGYLEDIPKKFRRSVLPLATYKDLERSDLIAESVLRQYFPASTHDLAGVLSTSGEMEAVYLKGFDFDGRYRLRTGTLHRSGDSDFQKINQHFVVGKSSFLRLKDIE